MNEVKKDIRFFLEVLVAVAFMTIVFMSCGCTLNVAADGSKSATVDGEAIAKILASK